MGIASLIRLVACSEPAASSFQLVVDGGYGGGHFAPGDVVTIWSGHDPNTSVVTGWEGDVDWLDDPSEWTTTLTMPSADIAVTPRVVEVSWNPDETTYVGVNGDRRLIRQIPATPTGLLIALHGTGGSALFPVNNLPMTTLARAALDRGMGVVAPEAEEVAVGDLDANEKIRWDATPSAQTVDAQNVARMLDGLLDEGVIDEATPLYTVGMSNGGAMAFTLATLLGGDAAAVYCASGREGLGDVSETPTSWWLCENDNNENVDNTKAVALHERLMARGVRTRLRSHPATPLHDERFARIDGINETQSRTIAQAIRQAELVDDDGLFTQELIGPDLASALLKLEPIAELAETPGLAGAVFGEIQQMQADHKMFDDFAQQTLDFLQDR
ncbi:MAG: hypothetical protein AAGA48_23755 [Myxococcota bacterium]